ncbi:hypothetical protein T06_15697 [Trichinella sp. T6]|nr:hypothetical protein T06_15697 [Trichinella sp. T6]
MPLLRALPKCKFLKCNRQFLQTLLSDICEKHFAAVSLQILKRFYEKENARESVQLVQLSDDSEEVEEEEYVDGDDSSALRTYGSIVTPSFSLYLQAVNVLQIAFSLIGSSIVFYFCCWNDLVRQLKDIIKLRELFELLLHLTLIIVFSKGRFCFLSLSGLCRVYFQLNHVNVQSVGLSLRADSH